jgi:hypothetical protein
MKKNQFKVSDPHYSQQIQNPKEALEMRDLVKRKFQLSTNEIGELRNSLYYVENRLEKELDVKNDLVDKAEIDRRKIIDLERKLREQLAVNRDQNLKINSLSDQLDAFTGSQDEIVQQLKDKFYDYSKEMEDKESKLNQVRNAWLETRDRLDEMTDERDRYLKDLGIANEDLIIKDAQIKRLNTELGIAERTIEEFINCKEKKISSFFEDETIYTDAKKIESILENMDDTKRDYSKLGKIVDESQLRHCRPYLIQKLKQEELRKLEIEAAMQTEPNLSILPEEIYKIIQNYRDRYGNELSMKQVDKMLVECNKVYHHIKQDQVLKVKVQLNAEITYLKRVLGLIIPLDKDKAKIEIGYLRNELKDSREDIRRLNIKISRKSRRGNNKSIDLGTASQRHGYSDEHIQDISTDVGYKSNSRFIEKALSVAESAVHESKGLNKKIIQNIQGFQSNKTKNYHTWREEDQNDDLLSEEWLISEINTALKGHNENVQKMMYASRVFQKV